MLVKWAAKRIVKKIKKQKRQKKKGKKDSKKRAGTWLKVLLWGALALILFLLLTVGASTSTNSTFGNWSDVFYTLFAVSLGVVGAALLMLLLIGIGAVK